MLQTLRYTYLRDDFETGLPTPQLAGPRQAVRTPKFDLFECATHGLAGEDTAGSGYRPRTARMSKSSHVEETASVKGLCGFSGTKEAITWVKA
jgi:hypothetical protein